MSSPDDLDDPRKRKGHLRSRVGFLGDPRDWEEDDDVDPSLTIGSAVPLIESGSGDEPTPEPKALQVINLFAGPGAGKSTIAAGLFHLMKSTGHPVELVTEYAKDLTYARDWGTLGNQLAVLGEQERRLHRLEGQVDWAITDSPLALGLLYVKGRYDAGWYRGAVLGAFGLYTNHNFFIRRMKPYHAHGRTQSEEQAREIDTRCRTMLANYGIPFVDIDGDRYAAERIFQRLTEGGNFDG